LRNLGVRDFGEEANGLQAPFCSNAQQEAVEPSNPPFARQDGHALAAEFLEHLGAVRDAMDRDAGLAGAEGAANRVHAADAVIAGEIGHEVA
jgi:hypothetical protein